MTAAATQNGTRRMFQFQPLKERINSDKASDLVTSAALSALFIYALVAALEWSESARLFPLGISLVGAGLSATFFLATCLRRKSQLRESSAPPLQLADNDEDSLEATDVFSTADRRTWTVSLAYLGGFFLALFAIGLYPTALLFTVLYLRFQGRGSWLFSTIYAVVLTGVLYAVFGLALQLPVPPGLF